MKAELVHHVKEYLDSGALIEITVWKVPATKDKPHGYKYSFAYIVEGERAIGYDNAEGKGDHRHHQSKEYPYSFESLEKVFDDFMAGVKRLEEEK